MDIDLTELEALNAVIQATGAAVQEQGRAVVSRGALNIKNDWRANAAASARSHGRRYPYDVNYDISQTPGVIEAEIGPQSGRKELQSFLAAVLEFGSVHNPPHNDGGRALEAEEDRFAAAVEAMAQAVLE
jgi:hypothetical protein